MRWRPLTWLVLSVFFFVAAAFLWNLGDKWAARKNTTSATSPTPVRSKPSTVQTSSQASASTGSFQLLNQPASHETKQAALAKKRAERFKYRLSNTSQSIGQLARNDKAILLENALLDTSEPISIPIPGSLHIDGDPGSYIVQSGKPIDAAFRARLQEAGATIVAYIPNNAYLVRATQGAAQQLADDPQTTVLAYDAYYKLKPSLLAMAMQDKALPDNAILNVLLFPDAREATEAAIQQMGGKVMSEEPSPFGTVVRVSPPSDEASSQPGNAANAGAPGLSPAISPSDLVPALARLPGVQEIEMVHKRVPANDLSRATIGVAATSQVGTNYLGLTGTNVLVNINDTGVDTNHPDLQGRVIFDVPISGVDSNGHGTHVAGTIAGSGLESITVTNAEGSAMPVTNLQFRGMAPDAQLLSLEWTDSDAYLQQTAAETNSLLGYEGPFISNNSWTYGGDNEYDLAAASYDAAVRDALPQVTGSQPGIYVFAAANANWAINIWDDGTEDNGFGGSPDTIESPATAKNVITVGAIEQPRGITNEVTICTTVNATNGVTNSSTFCATNQEWFPTTDSSDQVLDFSGMGNVGIGTEGQYGRFKPDVVAPGSMVISTRSTEWDQASYYNPTSYISEPFLDLQVTTNGPFFNFVAVPDNAVQVTIQVIDAFPSVPLPIYVNPNGPATNGFVETNIVTMPPDGGNSLTLVGANYNYAIFDPTNVPVDFDLLVTIAVTNQYGNFLQVLSNLNNSIGPYYRYESGTSMAAADVSGTLALMQEFFEQRLKITNSPALMKALLINGSRSLDLYDLGDQPSINYQGWGLVNLPNSLGTLTNLQATPKGPSSMFIFDQNPTNALATGQSNTVGITMSDSAAQSQPLRVTLVWTDPPGDPAAGIKLVNSLLLVVSNMDTGDVFFGNDIPEGSDFNLPWNTNSAPNLDVVNNVQNVYIGPPVGSNYLITVIGNRVNVNAVTQQTNDVVQDYALVISAGEGQVPDAFTLTNGVVSPIQTSPLVDTIVTNSFAGDPNDVGGILSNERVGANTPLLGTNVVPLVAGMSNAVITVGMTNQWNFFAVTNTGGTDFTNAAFLTFFPANLSIPRTGVYQEGNPANATRSEPDIDLYVTTDPSLTNLNPVAIALAYKSVSRGGEEAVVLSNAVSGTIYYIGVKSEDQEAAQYSFLADFSNIPFDQSNGQGDQSVRGFPQNAQIPTGTPQFPGIATIFGLCLQPITVHRVVVTNNISAQLMGALLGTLNHGTLGAASASSVLNNHAPSYGVTNQTFIYDDSGENNIPGARHTDGPGSLTGFFGRPGAGTWILTQSDNDPNHSGTNNSLQLFIEKQHDPQLGITVTLGAGGCDDEFLSVPEGATNLIVSAVIIQGTGPVSMQVCPLNTGGCVSTTLNTLGVTNSVSISTHSDPPLNPGTYDITLCNNGSAPVTVYLIAYIFLDQNPIQPVVYAATAPTPLLDDAVTYANINVPTNANVVTVDVGVRIDHPRISDLVLTLISPSGTRQLLMENRGGVTTNGIGTDLIQTNVIPVSATGGAVPTTNFFNTGTSSGSIEISYDMYQIPDSMRVYYGTVLTTNNLIWITPGTTEPGFGGGFASGSGTTNLNYPPPGYSGPASTVITIVMNQFGNDDTNTAWTYTITAGEALFNYLTFTENTNLTTIPIKFAVPPFTNMVPATNIGPVAMSDSFEFGPPLINYSGGGVFNGGWAESGTVSILTNGYGPGLVCDSGNQCLLLNGDTTATVTTNLILNAGSSYLLSFAYASDPDGSTNGDIPQTEASLDGMPLTTVTGATSNTWANVGWQIISVPLTANASAANTVTQQLAITEVTPGPGMLLDSFKVQLQTVQTGLFYLPEEPLTKVAGENAQGTWQLEIMDNRAGPTVGSNSTPTLLSWDLSFVLANPVPTPIPLTHGSSSTNTICGGQFQYFAVNVPNWAQVATNWLVSATGPINVFFDQNTEPTGTNAGDFELMANSTGGTFTLLTNSIPPLVPGATYFLGVQNTNTNCVTFVFQVDYNITALSNAVPVTSTIASNSYQRYFSFNVSTNATAVEFQLFNLSGDVNMVVSQTPFPDLENYQYGSVNPGTNNEQIIIFTNSTPFPLMPGEYYIGVFNQDTANVNYTIEATEFTNPVPNIITLEDGVPYTNSNPGTGVAVDTDYYQFDVTNTAVRAQFEIDDPTGQEVLVVREGLPLPTLTNYQLISANPGTNGQLLVLYNNSGPVLLSPGWWFLSAVNVSGASANYVIEATTWPLYGSNIFITGQAYSPSNFCITWTSVPGFDYFVQGKTSLTVTNWVTVSPTIKATDTNTTYCIPLPSPFQFFRVAEGLGATGAAAPPAPVRITSITYSTNGVLLQWTAASNSQFLVQWTPSLSPPAWNSFNGIVTSTNTAYSYLDNGTQDGGLAAPHYYRLLQLP